MTRRLDAVVHVMPDAAPVLRGEASRARDVIHYGVPPHGMRRGVAWRAGFWWLAVVLACCGATALAVVSLSEPAVAGWDGWRMAERGEQGWALQDAAPAGQEALQPLYACRVAIQRDVHIGRLRADFSGCHVGYDGRESEMGPSEVLGVSWRPGADGLAQGYAAGSERTSAAEAGLGSEAARLYLCRALYQGGMHPGQARTGEKGCIIGYGGKRVVAPTYDVLQAAPWLAWARATARTLPDTAIVGGSEGGETFYACRAAGREGLHPGKIKQNSPGCSIVSEGREMTVERFEVLVTRWLAGRAGTVPVSAVAAGRENGQDQFVCRAQLRDSVQVGKVSEALGGCHVGMQGREVVLAEYEVLAQ